MILYINATAPRSGHPRIRTLPRTCPVGVRILSAKVQLNECGLLAKVRFIHILGPWIGLSSSSPLMGLCRMTSLNTRLTAESFLVDLMTCPSMLHPSARVPQFPYSDLRFTAPLPLITFYFFACRFWVSGYVQHTKPRRQAVF